MAAEDGSTICKTCGFEMKAKTVDIVFKSFCQGEWSPQKDCNLVEDLNFVTLGIHPTPYPPVFYLSLEAFPCPRHFIALLVGDDLGRCLKHAFDIFCHFI